MDKFLEKRIDDLEHCILIYIDNGFPKEQIDELIRELIKLYDLKNK